MTGTDTFDAKGENEAAAEMAAERGEFSKSQNTLVSFIKVLADSKFMEGDTIYDFNDETNRIDLHIDILEAIKVFKFLLDENGKIRQDVSDEQLQDVKFKILKALKYAIMANDAKILMNVLKFLGPNSTNPSGFAYGPSMGFVSSGYNPWQPNGNRWNGPCI